MNQSHLIPAGKQAESKREDSKEFAGVEKLESPYNDDIDRLISKVNTINILFGYISYLAFTVQMPMHRKNQRLQFSH